MKKKSIKFVSGQTFPTLLLNCGNHTHTFTDCIIYGEVGEEVNLSFTDDESGEVERGSFSVANLSLPEPKVEPKKAYRVVVTGGGGLDAEILKKVMKQHGFAIVTMDEGEILDEPSKSPTPGIDSLLDIVHKDHPLHVLLGKLKEANGKPEPDPAAVKAKVKMQHGNQVWRIADEKPIHIGVAQYPLPIHKKSMEGPEWLVDLGIGCYGSHLGYDVYAEHEIDFSMLQTKPTK